MFATSYDGNGTMYTNAGTHSDIWVDGRRVMTGKGKPKVSKGRSAKRTVMVTGFGKQAKPYAHVISAGGKVLRHIKLGKSSGDNKCGQWFPRIDFKGAKPGTAKVVVNKSRKSTSANGGAVGKIKITSK